MGVHLTWPGAHADQFAAGSKVAKEQAAGSSYTGRCGALLHGRDYRCWHTGVQQCGVQSRLT